MAGRRGAQDRVRIALEELGSSGARTRARAFRAIQHCVRGSLEPNDTDARVAAVLARMVGRATSEDRHEWMILLADLVSGFELGQFAELQGDYRRNGPGDRKEDYEQATSAIFRAIAGSARL